MNSKRQTIWLVSMLSLMVILSAYYLFTDDVKQVDQTVTGDEMNEVVLNAVDLTHDDMAHMKSDEEIIADMQTENISTEDYFAQNQMKRIESQDKQLESLMEIVNSGNDEAVTAAMAEINELNDLQSKVLDLEARLTNQFANALVSQDGNQWTVSVQSEDLQTSEAASIADLVMQELGLTPSQIQIKMLK